MKQVLSISISGLVCPYRICCQQLVWSEESTGRQLWIDFMGQMTHKSKIVIKELYIERENQYILSLTVACEDEYVFIATVLHTV